jgi:hypothetical protein
MPVRFQPVIDCRDPEPLARFWAAALGYEFEPPPEGSQPGTTTGVRSAWARKTWGSARTASSIPMAAAPRIWFQVVPELKAVKNRWHLDVSVSGGRAFPLETRRQRVDAEAERLAGLGASYVRVLSEEGARSLRNRHARSRGQRVRHQLR